MKETKLLIALVAIASCLGLGTDLNAGQSPRVSANPAAAVRARTTAPSSVGGGRRFGTLRRCRNGYTDAGQGSACRAYIDSLPGDYPTRAGDPYGCYGDSIVEDWWSCVLPHGGISCPEGGTISWEATGYRCTFANRTYVPINARDCAAGYTLNIGEICGANNEMCCFNPNDSCGRGGETLTTPGGEVCCGIVPEGQAPDC